jgi:HrpA-like RNA helicase
MAPPPHAQVRQRLPIRAIQEQLVAALQRHDVVVVSGDTGCGKTTQVCSSGGAVGRAGGWVGQWQW